MQPTTLNKSPSLLYSNELHTERRVGKKPIPPFGVKRTRFDRVKVASTPRCGLGVFATASIKGGCAVGRVLGENKPKDFRSDYCVEFGDGALEPYPPYRFLNHSCAPNCQFIEWQIEDELSSAESPPLSVELWVHALHNIEPGEELTIDYGWDWQSAIPCKCGAPNCRGWICKEEELDICRKNHENDAGEAAQ